MIDDGLISIDSDLQGRVHPSVIERQEHLASEFAHATPFKHVVIDDFLDETYCQSLISEFPAFDPKLAINENGEVGAKAVHEHIRDIGPAYKAMDALSRSTAFRQLVGQITGIEDLHHDPHYFGGGTHENLHGQSLDAHVDFNYHPVTREHRRLNLIIYLNPEWEDSWGGSLQLHKDPYLPPSQDEIKVVTPLINRCVIFETNEYSWHGFKRIVLPEDKQGISRRSFALYYYTELRPEIETAAEHSTIYVEQHLPEWYEPDMKLSGEELQHIRNLVASRDQHLKRLYGDIKRLNTRIADLSYQLQVIQDEAGSSMQTEAPDLPETPDEKDFENQIQMLALKLSSAQKRISDMESSSSWRVTAPIRALMRKIRGY
jgi:Rps23 Pro-64 3,4-dihydroxylase Tpa1-like proline 4-hydroxylase